MSPTSTHMCAFSTHKSVGNPPQCGGVDSTSQEKTSDCATKIASSFDSCRIAIGSQDVGDELVDVFDTHVDPLECPGCTCKKAPSQDGITFLAKPNPQLKVAKRRFGYAQQVFMLHETKVCVSDLPKMEIWAGL